MSKEPKRNVYVGHRYVPKIMGEWDEQETYEGLSIVTNEGSSYTSKKRVPVGIDILNEEYWVITGNYNAQVEGYRQEVRNMQDEVNNKMDNTIDYVDNEVINLNNLVDDYNKENNKKILETSGSGVIDTGERFFGDLRVAARGTPNRTVNVYQGVAYMPSGERFVLTSPTVLDVPTSEGARRDIVYVSKDLELTYLAGQGGNTPPPLPEGGLLLAEIERESGVQFVYGRHVFDKREMKLTNTQIEDSLTSFKSIDNDDGSISLMLNTALTYVNKPNFIYGNKKTLFNDDSTPDETSGKYVIDCSSFVVAAMQGITYDNSKYKNYKNFTKPNALFFPKEAESSFDNRMLANDMALYAHKNGWLFKPLEDWSNVRVGDIVFLRNSPQHHFFLGIGHVQIVASKGQNGDIIVYEAYAGNSEGKIIAQKTYTIDQLVSRGGLYVARFPLGNTTSNASVINYEGNQEFTTSSYNFHTYDLYEPLQINQTYTMFFKGTFDDENSFPWLRTSNEQNIYSFTKDVIKRPDDWYIATFRIQDDRVGGEQIMLSNSNPDSSKIGGTVQEFYLFKGYVSSVNDFVYNLEKIDEV